VSCKLASWVGRDGQWLAVKEMDQVGSFLSCLWSALLWYTTLKSQESRESRLPWICEWPLSLFFRKVYELYGAMFRDYLDTHYIVLVVILILEILESRPCLSYLTNWKRVLWTWWGQCKRISGELVTCTVFKTFLNTLVWYERHVFLKKINI